MQLLKELYQIASPSRKEKRMRKFICDTLKKQGIKHKVDKIGNIYATKGSSDTYPCVVSHIDEVHTQRSKGFTIINTDDIIFGFDPKANKYCGIGADDKNGIWACLKCLEEFDVLKCAFFVGEEVGCYGSSRADMTFFEDCRYVLQCDRKGNSDLIRWAGATELCSDEFIAAIDLSSHGYKATNGMMTDVLALKQHELAVSCVNISCGYYNPHSDTELTRWSDLLKCLEFVRHIIRDCAQVYPHTHTPIVRYFGDWDMDDWYPSMRSNVKSHREGRIHRLANVATAKNHSHYYPTSTTITMDLNSAEVQVTTSLLLHTGVREAHLLRLADYGEMGEFYSACADRFPKENNPTYQYPSWENIPPFLINHHWICPNIFEIRDAMERLDESEYDYFVEWCYYHGHNLATDDANLLVAHFQDMCGSSPECSDEPFDLSEEILLTQCLSGSYFDTNCYAVEMFGEDYD